MEGPTTDPSILKLRAQQRRNFLTTLLLSQGTPMIAHGDEMARTQSGNNNVYCQDSPLSWINWNQLEEFDPLVKFTPRLPQSNSPGVCCASAPTTPFSDAAASLPAVPSAKT